MFSDNSVPSYFLWNITKPGKTGLPNYDLTKDEEACATYVDGPRLNEVQIRYERVITKLFKQYDIPLKITNEIRLAVRAKLWRMGKLFSKLGTKNHQEQLNKWKNGRDATWNFTLSGMETNRQLLSKKRKLEEQLDKENSKRRKLEKEVC